jgi:hypothetical protein
MATIAAAHALAITKGPIIDGELLPPLIPVAAARSFPIATAPIVAGEALGPLLLWPGPERYAAQWTIGQFDGAQWHDQDGWVFKPTQWSALPEVPE